MYAERLDFIRDVNFLFNHQIKIILNFMWYLKKSLHFDQNMILTISEQTSTLHLKFLCFKHLKNYFPSVFQFLKIKKS